MVNAEAEGEITFWLLVALTSPDCMHRRQRESSETSSHSAVNQTVILVPDWGEAALNLCLVQVCDRKRATHPESVPVPTSLLIPPFLGCELSVSAVTSLPLFSLRIHYKGPSLFARAETHLHCMEGEQTTQNCGWR